MSKFCPKCGTEISDKVKFCPECGADFDSFSVKKDKKSIEDETKKEFKINDTKVEEKKIEKKFSLSNIIIYGVIVLVIFIVLWGAVSHLSISPNQGNFVITPTESQTDSNTRIANEIVANYHQTHTYSLNDLYVCGDMASDVWDMLKAQGINAKINVGNVDKDISNITDANHAWVLAEVAPNQFLALEATGGYSVQKTDNPRYYYGWSFYNPKQLKNFEQLEKQYSDAYMKYNSAIDDYNSIVSQYNNASIFTRLILKSQVEDKSLLLQQRSQDLNQVIQQINALLASL